MKKIIGLLVIVMLLSVPFVCAEDFDAPEPGMGMMAKQMPPKFGMNCPMMPPAQMVAPEDGGVIVLVGNRLLKYDNALNLVKEVEIAKPGKSVVKKDVAKTTPPVQPEETAESISAEFEASAPTPEF